MYSANFHSLAVLLQNRLKEDTLDCPSCDRIEKAQRKEKCVLGEPLPDAKVRDSTLTLYRPGGHRCPLSPKFQFYFKKGSLKKFPMSVAPKDEKKNSGGKGLKVTRRFSIPVKKVHSF